MIVINHSKADHTDSYGGVTYVFKIGEEVEISESAAQELFGYGMEDKTPFVVRLGWTLTNVDLPHALNRLGQFEIKVSENHSVSPVVERVPLPSRRVGGKNMAA